ncbi:alpha/beta hydrolase fold-domain-containing protein [Epithele typhae]|uniref:alpha/beta hydrolase fold-domain-containing protein n=1 Tax=Epithele typhae TaxID=378194 RepID=UPI0020076B70|nr:alpha/beta hydrolase fold-domain-containing protein [Epithele typhae]KAH9935176.1 alpha/beta hydrolase fold-domain-containing protein [Epithele typhae]
MAYNHFAMPDPELDPLLKAIGPQPSDVLKDLKAFRKGFEHFADAQRTAFSSQLRAAEAALVAQDHTIAAEDGSFTVRSYYPSEPKDGVFPLLVWTHCGGMIVGGVETDDPFCHLLSHELQMTIVNVNYRLAPEHPFPTPLNDSYAALKWSVLNANLLHADLSRGIISGGASAGGALAAAQVHRAQSDPFFAAHNTKISGLFLQVPMLCQPSDIPEDLKANVTSFDQCAEAPMLSTALHKEGCALTGAKNDDPEFAPLLNTSFEGLPPTHIQAAGIDPLRDTGLAYAERLRAAGVPTKAIGYQGATHAFHYAFPETALARKWEREARDGLRWLMEQAKTP